MSAPDLPPDSDLPSDLPPQLEPTPMRPGGRGGALRTGNPGNRGGRGRTARRTIIRASKDLDAELARLRDMANSAHEVTCPCGCGHTFTPKPTSRMDSRDRIAYARLLADIKAGGKGEEEPPVTIRVATCSPADMARYVTGDLDGVELVSGEPTRLGPAPPNPKPDPGPPERTRSRSARE